MFQFGSIIPCPVTGHKWEEAGSEPPKLCPGWAIPALSASPCVTYTPSKNVQLQQLFPQLSILQILSSEDIHHPKIFTDSVIILHWMHLFELL